MKIEANPVHERFKLFEGDNWTLPTDITLIDKAEEAFAQKLSQAGWDQESDEVFFMGIAFREALVNAMVHGNMGIVKPEGSEKQLGELAKDAQKSNPTDKKVHITFDVTKDRVYLKIRDEGKGFRVSEVPDPTQSKGLMKTKGRGLLLMEKYFDTVEYLGNGNEVVLSKERKS
jgi:anti-sigma regulatory factor (Ser/Thr protein kinase)